MSAVSCNHESHEEVIGESSCGEEGSDNDLEDDQEVDSEEDLEEAIEKDLKEDLKEEENESSSSSPSSSAKRESYYCRHVDENSDLMQHIIQESELPPPPPTVVDPTICDPYLVPFRRAWWATIRMTTCERTCRHRSRSCEAIKLCNDCTGYYCKWLAELLGIPVLKASGKIDQETLSIDPLANLYWGQISKVSCCSKQSFKCLLCVRRYQLFTHFLPGHLRFRHIVHKSVTCLNREGFNIDMGLIRKTTRYHLERMALRMQLALPSDLGPTRGPATTRATRGGATPTKGAPTTTTFELTPDEIKLISNPALSHSVALSYAKQAAALLKLGIDATMSSPDVGLRRSKRQSKRAAAEDEETEDDETLNKAKRRKPASTKKNEINVEAAFEVMAQQFGKPTNSSSVENAAPSSSSSSNNIDHASQLAEEKRLATCGVRGVFYDPSRASWCTILPSSTTARHSRQIYSIAINEAGSLEAAKWRAIYERIRRDPSELESMDWTIRRQLSEFVRQRTTSSSTQEETTVVTLPRGYIDEVKPVELANDTKRKDTTTSTTAPTTPTTPTNDHVKVESATGEELPV